MLQSGSFLSQDREGARPSLKNIRVLLFVTTHLSDQHLQFLQRCWPGLVRNSALLQHADVLFFTAQEPPVNILEDAFPGKTVRVELYNNSFGVENQNVRKEMGAMFAMQSATTQHWFDGYDWVIRVNPDVLILDDEWLMNHMVDSDVDGIFADCDDGNFARYCHDAVRVNTDFFAFRPTCIGPESFIMADLTTNAEVQAKAAFTGIIEQGRDRWIVGTNMQGQCRIRGQQVPVLHAHMAVNYCPLAPGQPEWRDFE